MYFSFIHYLQNKQRYTSNTNFTKQTIETPFSKIVIKSIHLKNLHHRKQYIINYEAKLYFTDRIVSQNKQKNCKFL